MSKRVYISGRVSNLPEEVYRPHFKKAEEFLKGLGYEVCNPVEDEEIQRTYREEGYAPCLVKCMDRLSRCDMIYMLMGFITSPGALAEKAFANACKMEIIFECTNNYNDDL